MTHDIQPTDNNLSGNSRRRSGALGQLNNLQALSGTPLPSLFKQLVIFVLDGSGSMTFDGTSGKSKGEEVESAVKMVLERLRTSRNKTCFDVWIWGYADESVEILPITPALSVNLTESINPCNFIKKYQYTKLAPTLNQLEEPITNYLNKNDKSGSPAKVMVLVLSDGQLHDLKECQRIAARIKLQNRSFLSAMFFESDGIDHLIQDQASNNLRGLASNEGLFIKTTDVEAIRDHMIHSIGISSVAI